MYTKGEWKAGFNPSVTGPTTPTVQSPVCGGKDWPYRTVNVGTETIAIVPAPDKDKAHIPNTDEMEANAQLIASAPTMHKEIKATIEKLTIYLGEWASVNELYSPEWTHAIKRIIFHLEEALAKADRS